MGAVRSRQLKKGQHFPGRWLKKVVSFFLSRKNRATPSVAAQGDTNPSDATAFPERSFSHKRMRVRIRIICGCATRALLQTIENGPIHSFTEAPVSTCLFSGVFAVGYCVYDNVNFPNK